MGTTATNTQKQILDAAFAKLLSKPTYSRWVTGPELRFVLKALGIIQKDEMIRSCAEIGFLRQESGEQFFFTTEGLFQLTDHRPVRVIQAVLTLLKQKYTENEGSRVLYFDWSELRNQDKHFFHVDCQYITWQVVHITEIASAWIMTNGKDGTDGFEARVTVTLKENEQEALEQEGWSLEAFRKLRQPPAANATKLEQPQPMQEMKPVIQKINLADRQVIKEAEDKSQIPEPFQEHRQTTQEEGQMPIDQKTATALREAIQAAYPNVGALRILVNDALGAKLQDITSLDRPIPQLVFELFEWCESNGRLEEFLRGASKNNSGNPKLRAAMALLEESQSATTRTIPTKNFLDAPPPLDHGVEQVQKLHKILKQAYSNTERAKHFTQTVLAPGDVADIDFNGAPKDVWWRILDAVCSLGALRKLVEKVLNDSSVKGFYPQIRDLTNP
jgi:hypothetical protein